MRRNVMLGLAWVLATGISVTIAAAAVGSVRDQVTDRPAPLVTAAAALASSSTPAPVSSSSSEPPVSSTQPQPNESTTTTAGGGTTSTTAVTTTTTPPATTTTSSPATTTTQAFTVSSHELVGGWVRIRYTDSVVLLDGANPKPGFSVEADHVGPHEVKIEFEGSGHKSVFRAAFENGEIDILIREEDDD